MGTYIPILLSAMVLSYFIGYYVGLFKGLDMAREEVKKLWKN